MGLSQAEIADEAAQDIAKYLNVPSGQGIIMHIYLRIRKAIRLALREANK